MTKPSRCSQQLTSLRLRLRSGVVRFDLRWRPCHQRARWAWRLSSQSWSSGVLAAVATYFEIVDVEAAIGLSGNTMILTAAMVVFREDRFYLGVALVAVFGGLDYIAGASREFYKMVINAGVDAWRSSLAPLCSGRSLPQSDRSQIGSPRRRSARRSHLLHRSLRPAEHAAGDHVGRAIPSDAAAAPRDRSARLSHSRWLGLGVGWVYIDLGPPWCRCSQFRSS